MNIIQTDSHQNSAAENPIVSMSKAAKKSASSSNKDPLDRALFDAARRTLRNARAAAEKSKAIPLETKFNMLEVDFPSVRNRHKWWEFGEGHDKSDVEVEEEDFDYDDCIKTLTTPEIQRLQRAVQKNDHERNFLMIKTVWDQMKEFHEILEENESQKAELEKLRSKCQSLQSELSEKDEKLSSIESLERDVVDLKLNLAEAKGSSDIYQMKMAKLEMELKSVQEENDRLHREKLAGSLRSSNLEGVPSDENPNEATGTGIVGQILRRRSSHLTQSWNDEERERKNVRDTERPATKKNLLARSCKWVLSQSTRNHSKDIDIANPEIEIPIEESTQAQSRPVRRISPTNTFNKSLRQSLMANFAPGIGHEPPKFEPLKNDIHRRRSWSTDNLKKLDTPDRSERMELHSKSKSFNNSKNIIGENNSATWQNVIWDGRSGSGETDVKSSNFQRRATVQMSNARRPHTVIRAESHDFTGDTIIAKSVDEVDQQSDCDGEDSENWARMSSITLDTFRPAARQEPGSPTEEHIIESTTSQVHKSLIMRRRRENKDENTRFSSLLLKAKSERVVGGCQVSDRNETSGGISLAFC